MAKGVKLPLRAQQAAATRSRILDGAARVFERQGYTGARIEDIAGEAGVAVATVYKIFTNKATLLSEVVDRAMAGTDGGVLVEDQPWWQEQFTEPDPVRQLRLIARNARRICDRAARVLEVVREAAPLDDRIARIKRELSAQRLERSERTASRFLRSARPQAHHGVRTTALTLWSLTAPELYTDHLSVGRSPAEYERWLSNVLVASLLR